MQLLIASGNVARLHNNGTFPRWREFHLNVSWWIYILLSGWWQAALFYSKVTMLTSLQWLRKVQKECSNYSNLFFLLLISNLVPLSLIYDALNKEAGRCANCVGQFVQQIHISSSAQFVLLSLFVFMYFIRVPLFINSEAPRPSDLERIPSSRPAEALASSMAADDITPAFIPLPHPPPSYFRYNWFELICARLNCGSESPNGALIGGAAENWIDSPKWINK